MKNQANIRTEEKKMNTIRELCGQIIACGTNDKEYTRKLTGQLLEYQQEDGSFCVADECPTERDCRIFYYYEPTYYGAAALMHAMLAGQNEADETATEALRRALPATMQRKLVGHGYDATRQRLGALKIFKDAGLYEWMYRFDNPSDTDFHGFCEMIREIISGFRKAVLSGRTWSDWNVDFREAFEKEIEDYEEGLVPYVWYASYGSNLSSNRFQEYMQRCGGDAETESRAYTAHGKLYFAGDSVTWGRGKGVAFLDETAPGEVLMRIYRITRGQFREVQRMEGSKYSRKLRLGFIDDAPVYTFTAPEKRKDLHAPSFKYVQTILEGLKETFPEVTETALLAYLFIHGAVNDDARGVLTFIRKAPHAVTIRDITDGDTCRTITRTRDAVRFLAELGLIRQDARSRRAGHSATDAEAMYFTEPEKRDVTDLVALGVV